jgi:transcriptional regulator with XRE-family HTH domain
MTDELSARQPAASFAALLRQLRVEARLTQEELAEAAGLSTRSISDLERGVSRTARKETARLLADALAMAGPVRAPFVAAARGKGSVCEVLAMMENLPTWPPPAAKVCGPSEDLGLALHYGKIGQLIDAMTAASVTGGSVAGIWVIGVTTVIAGKTTQARPGVPSADAASTGGVGQPTREEPPGRRRSPLADQAVQPFGHAAQSVLREAVAAAPNNDPVAIGTGPRG